MTAKFALLAVAALSLVACETTEHNDVAAKPARIVVRGAIVPDEPSPSPAKRGTTHAAVKTGAVAAPAVVADAATATEPATAPATATPLVAPAETAPSTSETTPAAPSAPAVDTAPAATPSTDVPAVQSVTPTSPAADAKPTVPEWRTSDIPALIQAMIGGVPLWMMALIGAVLLAAIAFGMSGGRKAEEPEDSRHEPETA